MFFPPQQKPQFLTKYTFTLRNLSNFDHNINNKCIFTLRPMFENFCSSTRKKIHSLSVLKDGLCDVMWKLMDLSVQWTLFIVEIFVSSLINNSLRSPINSIKLYCANIRPWFQQAFNVETSRKKKYKGF